MSFADRWIQCIDYKVKELFDQTKIIRPRGPTGSGFDRADEGPFRSIFTHEYRHALAKPEKLRTGTGRYIGF